MHKVPFNNSTVMNSTEDTSMSVKIDLQVLLLVNTLAEVTEVDLVVVATVVVDIVEEVSEVDMDVVDMVEVLEEVAMEVVAMEVGVTEVVDMVVGIMMVVDMAVGEEDHIHMPQFLPMNSLTALQLAVSPLLLFLCRM